MLSPEVLAAAVLVALALDRWLGEPPARWHPVVWIGHYLGWAGRRVAEGNTEYDGHDQLWQMPQGGIDEGEDHLAAARRELFEETGMETVELIVEQLYPVIAELGTAA